MALSFLDLAREEAAEGYQATDEARIRDAAERAWLAALHGIDHAMSRRGLIPEPGPMAQASRHSFLEAAGRHDLSEELLVFADWLHERIFNFGTIPDRAEMELLIDEVGRFVRTLSPEG